LLAEQVCSPVQWHASVNRFIDAGFRLFVEVGPGRVLKGLMRRISASGTRVLSAGEPEAVRKTAQELLEPECSSGAPAT
jgi:[acyl-carrier-protein] S-malonyltransferase